MAILTNSGRIAIAKAVMEQEIHLAWGSGDPDWDDTPVAPDVTNTELVNEIGRRRVTQALYCLPDPLGELVVPEGRFTQSLVPTNYIYTRFTFDFSDAPTSEIREVAVFLGTERAVGVPLGKDYLEPAEVADPGQMLEIERVPKITRSALVRQQFEFVTRF